MASEKLLLLFLPLVVAAAAAVDLQTAADPVNKSASLGGFWAASKSEGDLLSVVDSVVEDDPAAVYSESVEDDEFAGGFSSLEGMLQWSIGHSDPEKLNEKAKDVKNLSGDELKKRQLEIKELMERLKMPSDAELMKIAISDLNNSTITLEDQKRALDELFILVEPIDNANDLDKHGGLVAVVRQLHSSDQDIRTTAAWILGKASQNNALVQDQILSLGALPEIMKMVNSSHVDEAVKALYTISALIRNNEIGQKFFIMEQGNLMLQEIMINSKVDIRIRKKVVLLVTDLADYELYAENTKLSFLSEWEFLKAVVDLLLTPDLDLQEKVLLAMKNLIQLSTTEALDLKGFCSLDKILERLKENIDKLMLEDDHRDYAMEIERLRNEVHAIFHLKLKANQAPT